MFYKFLVKDHFLAHSIALFLRIVNIRDLHFHYTIIIYSYTVLFCICQNS